jgi:Arc/MetJ-type ribon-helix-helix transcriptional regulator
MQLDPQAGKMEAKISQTFRGANMILSLQQDVQRQIDDRVNSGKYSSPEDVVAAAIMALEQQERFGDFGAGELDELLAEGERSIAQEGTLDGDEAYRLRCRRRADRRSSPQ